MSVANSIILTTESILIKFTPNVFWVNSWFREIISNVIINPSFGLYTIQKLVFLVPIVLFKFVKLLKNPQISWILEFISKKFDVHVTKNK